MKYNKVLVVKENLWAANSTIKIHIVPLCSTVLQLQESLKSKSTTNEMHFEQSPKAFAIATVEDMRWSLQSPQTNMQIEDRRLWAPWPHSVLN